MVWQIFACHRETNETSAEEGERKTGSYTADGCSVEDKILIKD